MKGLTIMIGQLGLFSLPIGRQEKKDVNKQISRPFVNRILTIIC